VKGVRGVQEELLGRKDLCANASSGEAARAKEIGLERTGGDAQLLSGSLWSDAIHVAEVDDGLVLCGHVLEHIY
jgi:hypothetical protein